MEDDDMIVVVVGDDEGECTGDSDKKDRSRNLVPIKMERLDEKEVMDIIATAARYGQSIIMDNNEDKYIKSDEAELTFEQAIQNIKKECSDMTDEYNAEGYESENYDFKDDEYLNLYKFRAQNEENNCDEDYKVESDDDYDSDYEVSDDERVKKGQFKKRLKMLSPSLQKSFIDDLRQQYPELRNDQHALIKSLVEIMRNEKPPEPPRDFFLMNDIMYECCVCGAITNCIPAATRHYQEKHGPRYLVCYACGVDFRSKTNLYKHEKRCKAPDAIIMLKARAMFLGRKGRSRPFIPDMRTVPLHTSKNLKQYKCCECSGTFRSRTQMIAHLNMHNGVRPFTCEYCARAYTSIAALTRHRKMHSNNQFICDHCNATFKVKSALAAHMNSHEKIPRYPCTMCPKRYATKNALNHHVRRVHLNLPMPCACQVCPNRYPRMSILKDHMKKAHGMTLMTRKMFFKALPTLTETQLQQAKAILKTDEPIINLSADINTCW